MFEYTWKEIINCKEEIETITEELKTLPEGHLIRKGAYYYHCINNAEKGITREPLLIRQLARKAYLRKRQKCLEESYAVGKRFLACNRGSTPEEMIESLSETYRRLPMDYFFIPAENDWQNQPYETNPYLPEQRSIISNSGISVRSKSELIIANALDSCHVPYRYEAALLLGRNVKYPDFTIMRPFDGKLVYWEHFGLTDRADYMKSMTTKIHDYMENDIVLWRDLVCTFEDDIKDSKRIYQLIEWFILRNYR